MVDINLPDYLAKPNESLGQHTLKLEYNAAQLFIMGYINEYIYSLLHCACHYHDYGKVNSMFQERVRSGGHFDESREAGHNILSLFFIDKNLFPKRDYLIIANAVLNHHHYRNNVNQLNELKRNEKLFTDLLKEFQIFGVPQSYINKLKDVAQEKDGVLVQGLLYKCDYAASASAGQNLEVKIEYPNDFLNKSLASLMEDWQVVNPDCRWNDLQQFCLSHTDENIVVTAQTGMGKTEGGLLWLGDNKGFYILPLKTAINAIYERIRCNILHGENIGRRVALLHSDNAGYLLSGNAGYGEIGGFQDYRTRSQQFSLPLTISTPDQLFDFVFKYPGHELKPAILSYSKVIIDEIQAYSGDLLAYIVRGLEVIHEMGGKFAILTATLPPYIKDVIRKNRNNPKRGEIAFAEGAFVNDLARHNLKVMEEELSAEAVYDKFAENEAKGGSNKILVVCNTVKKAQQIYSQLKQKGLENVNLLHSKFIKLHRSDKERQILEDGKTFNTDGTLNKKSTIWIATQIVEASLDIDFDYLFTELSDLNGLFQRLGRCNRKGMKSAAGPNCFVFTQIPDGLLRKRSQGKGFIDKGLFELSRKALANVDGILSEQQKLKLINENLTTAKLEEENSVMLRDFKASYQFVMDLYPNSQDSKDIGRNFRNIISYDVIPLGIYQEHEDEIDSWQAALSHSDLEYHQRIELQEKIKQFTVPVGYYDIYFGGEKGNADAIFENKSGKKIIDLNSYSQIYVVRCHYDEENGFSRLTKEEKESLAGSGKAAGDIEDNYDSFM